MIWFCVHGSWWCVTCFTLFQSICLKMGVSGNPLVANSSIRFEFRDALIISSGVISIIMSHYPWNSKNVALNAGYNFQCGSDIDVTVVFSLVVLTDTARGERQSWLACCLTAS